MTNKEKFLKLVTGTDTDFIEKLESRIKNRAMLRESQKIALKVLLKLDELNWNQIDLANKMEVSPQQINKIVSGKENLTIETQIKLQNILDIPILASYYENKLNKNEEIILNFDSEEKYKVTAMSANNYSDEAKSIQMVCDLNYNEYSYCQKTG